MGIREVCTAVFLGMTGWKDWKSREISPGLTGIFGCAGFVMSVVSDREWSDYLIPVGLGFLFLALSLASRGALGMGDGWVLLALGLVQETGAYMRMLSAGMLLAACFSAVLLLGFKKNRKTEIPFVPFLFLGYLGGVLIWK